MDVSKTYYIYYELEKMRALLLNNEQQINFLDYGAGNNDGQRQISTIAKESLSTKAQCRLLFNLVSTFQPKTVLEFGTSLGISTLYLSNACKSSSVHTMEGNPDSRQIAVNLFAKMKADNIESHVGEFDSVLNKLLPKLNTIDFAYLDGNHQKEATLQYFYQLLPKFTADSIVVLDDIYWSKGMTEAWNELKAHQDVTLSIDLFDIGILFFNTNLSKEQLALIDYWKKPWKLGIFG